MKKLHILTLKSFVGPFLATFFIAIFVLVMQFVWLYIDDFVGKGLSIVVISRLFSLAAITMVPMALPIAVLLAAIMTFGNFGEHFELTAIKSSGISLQRIMSPLIIVAIIISIGAFTFAEKVIPVAHLKMLTLLFDIRQQNPSLDIQSEKFNNDVTDVSIRILKKNPKNNMMYDFMMYDHTNHSGNSTVIIADSGKMQMSDDLQYLLLTLYSGKTYEELSEDESLLEKRSFPHRIDQFETQTLFIKLRGFNIEESDESLYKKNYQMLNMRQLRSSIDSLSDKYQFRDEYFLMSLNRNKYLRSEIKLIDIEDSVKYLTSDSIKRSIKVENLIIVQDLDTLYAKQTIQKKQNILQTALDYAIATEQFVNNSKKELRTKQEWIAKYEITWHKKITFSIACLIFFFIGAPLGAIIRKGGFGLPVVVSVFFFLLYYILTMFCEKFVREVVWNEIFGMWLPSLLVFPLGIFLTYKATTDSVILNFDSYVDGLKKIIKKIRRKKFRLKK